MKISSLDIIERSKNLARKKIFDYNGTSMMNNNDSLKLIKLSYVIETRKNKLFFSSFKKILVVHVCVFFIVCLHTITYIH